MAKSEEKRNKLLNDSVVLEKQKQMFINEERTEHKDILPAKYRITDYKRKTFGRLFQAAKSNYQEKQGIAGNRPISSSQYSQGMNSVVDVTTQATTTFEEEERSTITHPFKFFYTTGEPVEFTTVNRFEGRSNYNNYYPSNDIETEQKLEKFWFMNKNKEITDKRREEELKQMVQEWSLAKSRIQEESHRRREGLNDAS
jgi:DNA-binding PadR family transcriptional regulator